MELESIYFKHESLKSKVYILIAFNCLATWAFERFVMGNIHVIALLKR